MTGIITLIGAPTDVGAGARGASMGPEALRVAQLQSVLEAQGLEVIDRGNLGGPPNPWQPPVSGYRHLPEVTEWNRLVHAAVLEELAAPDAPRLAPVEGTREALDTCGARATQGLGELDTVGGVGEPHLGVVLAAGNALTGRHGRLVQVEELGQLHRVVTSLLGAPGGALGRLGAPGVARGTRGAVDV